ncbi:MAG: Ribosomal large subunit methyltransferase [Fibrobacteres bacterium]|nr:Ribosomal large subunit methyltransferase [Fibrobacterota bacterium]
MKIRFVCVGKLANPHLKALADDYRKRLDRVFDLEIVEVKDSDDRDGAARLAKEADRIRAAAEPLSECMLWDELGEAMDSRGFSVLLVKLENQSSKRLTMIIGSSHGVADSLKAEIPRKVQLSKFTFTHEWARVLALEQLYRARCIQKNLPYHH